MTKKRHVSDIIGGKEMLAVRPEETVREAARRMAERNVACVLVTDANRKLLGIFTERDMLRRVVVEGRDPAATRVSAVMTTELRVVVPETNAIEAMRFMLDNHVRHLPVAVNGQAVGVVSLRDFLGAEMEEIRQELERRERLWES
jgi:signal-transduction protein with cAMP-binding, CBS, and nucleotidyltransferase domain